MISGNGEDGFRSLGATNTLIAGNFVGTNASGTAAIGNGIDGVDLQEGHGNVIGGSTAGHRNIISGNRAAGIILRVTTATVAGTFDDANRTRIQGNYVGTDVTGTVAIGNGIDSTSQTGAIKCWQFQRCDRGYRWRRNQ